MISINKSKTPPPILSNSGKTETENLCNDFLANKANYENGEKRFEFKSSIYGSKSVKKKLIKSQHDKCFLCESKITHISYGDVEHFRPKGGSKQTTDDEMLIPGYYWLAYDWTNLFLACQICNQRFKKNLFPLKDIDKRAKSHENSLNEESPLFINPETDDPEQFISFRGEIPFAIDENIRGITTISASGIDRVELNEKRLSLLKKLKRLYEIANLSPQLPESIEALDYLQNECQSDEEEYSSMVRANLDSDFKFVNL